MVRLKIGGALTSVDLLKTEDPEALRLVIGGREYHVDFRSIDEGRYVLTVNGKQTEVFVARGELGKHIFIKGREFFVQDADLLPLKTRKPDQAQESAGDVTPPMPAVVVRILVKEGDQVKKGQGLVAVSAMKMETTLVAPRDGVVKRIHTSVHAKVAPGDVLVEIQEGGLEA
jgi:3-methylcrotonyl-CoA carboxylase alpha subunit